MSDVFTLPCGADEIEHFLAQPTEGVRETLRRQTGDILVAGAGGKMGPTVCLMLAKALREIGSTAKVHAASRFSNAEAVQVLETGGVKTVTCDLMDRASLAKLPNAPNVIFMAGQKFGTSSSPEMTWVMNTLVPANVCERFPQSRLICYSTGCVYPLSTVASGGSTERDEIAPVGDYPNSCVGRERVMQHFAKKNGTPIVLFRLNYAIEFRYGVLLDIARKVWKDEELDVTMGHVNLIWQGDAAARSIQCLDIAASPALPLNVTGPETVSVRALGRRFGEIFGKEPKITGTEAETAWLGNAAESFRHFGYPTVSLEEMIHWVAAWVKTDGRTLGKPTHFQTRSGKF